MFDQIKDVAMKHGGDTFFIQKESAAQGEATGRRTHIDGDEEKYLKREDPEYECIKTPNQREATPLEYFENARGSANNVSNHHRLVVGTQEMALNNGRAS